MMQVIPFKTGFKPFSKLKIDSKAYSILLPTAGPHGAVARLCR